MMMSQDAALFVVTEGIVVDPRFYEESCQNSPKVERAGFQLWRIESFSIAGVTAGGKGAVLSLHDHLKKLNALSVKSRHGKRSILLCVDADADRLTKRTVKSAHVLYTRLPDAEAEVIASSDLRRAVGASMSLTDEQTTAAISYLGDFASTLATAWKDWLVIGCLRDMSTAAKGPCGGSPPSIKDPQQRYKRIAPARVAQARNQIASSSPLTASQLSSIERKLLGEFTAMIAAGRSAEMLKGKWLTSYLRFRLNEFAARYGLRKLGSDAELFTAICVASRVQQPWLRHFRAKAYRLI